MTAAPRIALLTPGWPGQNTPNGIATSVYFLAMGLQAIGHPPVILTREVDGPCPEGIPVIRIPDLGWRWRDRLRARFGDAAEQAHWQTARNFASAIREAVAAHGVDVVIMEETNGWSDKIRQLVPVPVILTLHGPWTLLKTHVPMRDATENRKREERENRGFLSAAGLIAPSRNVLAAVEKAVPLADRPRIVLPNSFHAEVPDKLAACHDPRDILYVGRVDYLKGADVVLESFERLSRTHPRARLTFVGEDKGLWRPDGTLAHMEDLLAALPAPLRVQIRYAGILDRAEIARLRRSHAIALITSRYETFGYTLLEAMAAGQAIVCTKVGGPAEVLGDGRTALLVPPGDPEATAEALRRLLEDQALTRRLGETARAELTRDFDPTRIAGDTLRFVAAALSSRAGR